VILYADKITRSMQEAIGETERRRAIQAAFNKQHGIIPTSAKRAEQRSLGEADLASSVTDNQASYGLEIPADPREQQRLVESLKREMFDAAARKEYEVAMQGDGDGGSG
jgi:excinuclease ABC subunit B